jgi:hypothetical protein
MGDVVEEENGDLMGEGVNIAARLEGIAEPGTVLLSEDANRQVRSRLDLIVQDLGEVQLKNIAERVRVYSLRVSKAPADIPRRVGSKRVWLALGALGVAAAVAGSAVLFFSNHTPQLASSRADLPLSCTSLKEYSDRSKARNAQLMSTPVGDKALHAWCITIIASCLHDTWGWSTEMWRAWRGYRQGEDRQWYTTEKYTGAVRHDSATIKGVFVPRRKIYGLIRICSP